MAYVVASYYVFYQTYPNSLNIVFCFLENVMDVKTLNRLIKRDSLVVFHKDFKDEMNYLVLYYGYIMKEIKDAQAKEKSGDVIIRTGPSSF